MQPNIDIPLLIVAPMARRQAAFREIRRPVFASLPTPLVKACRYIAFERLAHELTPLEPGLHGRAEVATAELIEQLHQRVSAGLRSGVSEDSAPSARCAVSGRSPGTSRAKLPTHRTQARSRRCRAC